MVPNLRFKINDIHKLSQCKSNNSRCLSINVSDLLQNNILTGIRIELVHETLGVIFAYVVNANGSIVSELSDISNMISIDNVLYELKRYGFDIEYEESTKLDGRTLDLLFSLSKLGFDKIRVLQVMEGLCMKSYIIGFKSDAHPRWLNNLYVAYYNEYLSGLTDGTLIDISAITKDIDWHWLNFVGNIDDILDSNK